jgi:mRNA-degrading endonuclease RelE of RelBE toxin-antitoxin system
LAGRVLYKSSVGSDLKKISPRDVVRVLRDIRAVLGADPGAGEPLAGEFRGLFRLRVGDHPVIYTVLEGNVLVLRVGRRDRAYG